MRTRRMRCPCLPTRADARHMSDSGRSIARKKRLRELHTRLPRFICQLARYHRRGAGACVKRMNGVQSRWRSRERPHLRADARQRHHGPRTHQARSLGPREAQRDASQHRRTVGSQRPASGCKRPVVARAGGRVPGRIWMILGSFGTFIRRRTRSCHQLGTRGRPMASYLHLHVLTTGAGTAPFEQPRSATRGRRDLCPQALGTSCRCRTRSDQLRCARVLLSHCCRPLSRLAHHASPKAAERINRASSVIERLAARF